MSEAPEGLLAYLHLFLALQLNLGQILRRVGAEQVRLKHAQA
jgi:hypothetical protein